MNMRYWCIFWSDIRLTESYHEPKVECNNIVRTYILKAMPINEAQCSYINICLYISLLLLKVWKL